MRIAAPPRIAVRRGQLAGEVRGGERGHVRLKGGNSMGASQGRVRGNGEVFFLDVSN